MTNENPRIGNCLCGAVSVSVSVDKIDLGACHCPKCQKWAGGPLFELECGKQVSFDGMEHIKIYRSSELAERGFCQECGSHLFIKDVQSGEYGIPPGIFDNTSGIEFRREVFSDKKPAFYCFANDTISIDSETIYQHFPQVKQL